MKLRAKEPESLEFPGYIWHIQMQQVCQQRANIFFSLSKVKGLEQGCPRFTKNIQLIWLDKQPEIVELIGEFLAESYDND